jgi:hypothetical protein
VNVRVDVRSDAWVWIWIWIWTLLRCGVVGELGRRGKGRRGKRRDESYREVV